MNRDQFLRSLRAYCRANGLPAPEFDARKGKGSHGTVSVGQRFTTLPSGELKRPLVRGVLEKLGLPKDAI